MIRAEILMNKSVQDFLISSLEKAVPDFFYSLIPLTQGRGKESRKLGTTVWPETNVTLISYCDDDKEPLIKTVVDYAKEKFSSEGIKLFILHEK